MRKDPLEGMKHHKHKTIRPNPLFTRIVKPLIHLFLQHRYNTEIEDRVGVRNLQAPYFVVGNHVNYWDPFFVSVYLPHDVQWITSDNVFRTKIFHILMKLFGSIPTSKFMTDIKTVAQILRVIKGGGVIGIFPEGRKTWDGRPLPHIATVAKLIHRLKLPVVGVVIRGGYLSKPRWGRGLRRGKVHLEYRRVFEPEELKEISEEECYRRLEERIHHDEFSWNREKRIPFMGKWPAEYIERALFVCPKCHRIASFYSHGDTAECRDCGYTFSMDRYGDLQPVNGPLVFTTIPEWNDWQLYYFRTFLVENLTTEVPLFTEKPAILWHGYRTEPLKRLNTGHVHFFPSKIEFHTTIGREKLFLIEDLNGENVQDKEKLEFYHANSLYRLDFLNVRASAYMWYSAINIIHKEGLLSSSGKQSALRTPRSR